MNQLRLERFTPETVFELSKLMLGKAGENPRVLSLLLEETVGNAFFLVEVVRVLAEEAGYLSAIGSKALPQNVFTGGIQQVIRRRLQQIPERGQSLLGLAAVIGRQLDLELIQHILKEQPTLFLHSEELDDWLRMCANYAVLELAEQQWRFAHDKLRETLLTGLSEIQCQRFHRFIALGIEALHADDLLSQAGQLLDHWKGATNAEKVLYYLPPVIRRQIELGHMAFADDLLSEWEEWLEHIAEEDRVSSRKELLYLRAWITYQRGDYSTAVTLYTEANQVAQQLGDEKSQIRGTNFLAYGLFCLGRTVEAHQRAEKNLVRGRLLNEKFSTLVSLRVLCWITRYRGQYDAAIDYIKQSLAIAHEIDDRSQIALNVAILGGIADDQGDYETAHAYYEEGLVIAQEIGHQVRIVSILVRLGMIAANQGRYENAQQNLEQGLIIARQVGDQENTARCLGNLGLVAMMQQQYDVAQDYLDQCLTVMERVGYQTRVAFYLTKLGALAMIQQHYNAAEAYLAKSLTISRQVDYPSNIVVNLSKLSQIAFLQGEPEKGRVYCFESLTIANDIGLAPQLLSALVAAVAYKHQRGERVVAAEWANFILNHWASTADHRMDLELLRLQLELGLGEVEDTAVKEQPNSLNLRKLVLELLEDPL